MTEQTDLIEDDWAFRRPRVLWVAIAALAPLGIAGAVSYGLLVVGMPILPWFGAAMFAAATLVFAALLTRWLIRRGSLAFARRADLIMPAFIRALLAILIADIGILIWFVAMAPDGDIPRTVMSIWLVGSLLTWLLGTPIAFLCVLLFGFIALGRIRSN
ncbi:MAG: hypothetical protein ABJ215_07360 [Alphaproteobacteria bacterium]